MNIYKFTVGNFAVNNYLVHPVDSSKAILFDAGDETEPILKKIDELGLELIYLVNTHGHSDHIFGNKIILEHTGAQLLIHELDEPFLFNPQLNLSAFLGAELESPKPDRILHEGDTISLENLEFKVLHTPGHTPGHISLLSDGHAFVGDVIFQGSVGRTDLPKSSGQQLIHTIRTKIYDLPDETNLYPGHGPNTTVGQEKVSNPFVSI
ncbi:MAG: MBL fold metallo-hydrolase [Calditrichia bacterium]|nr:MBL fold metallo-hydrolase [Calditrichia bacterium]MCK5454936.1 MBL fold metallo-hydrolase [Calditrichia bacterium]